jgi:hypothetical protein
MLGQDMEDFRDVHTVREIGSNVRQTGFQGISWRNKLIKIAANYVVDSKD